MVIEMFVALMVRAHVPYVSRQHGCHLTAEQNAKCDRATFILVCLGLKLERRLSTGEQI
jgi:hypothetical protein